MEILTELEKMMSSLNCLIQRFEKVVIEDKVDVESNLCLFSTAVKQNEVLKGLIVYNNNHKDEILDLALSCLTVVNDVYESLENPNQEDKQKLIDIVNMTVMMSKTYLYLYKRTLSGNW